VPSPHPSTLSNARSIAHRQCYRPTGRILGHIGGTEHRSTADNPGQGMTW
jgi:hypothetical protein